jgi:hypothetical protein
MTPDSPSSKRKTHNTYYQSGHGEASASFEHALAIELGEFKSMCTTSFEVNSTESVYEPIARGDDLTIPRTPPSTPTERSVVRHDRGRERKTRAGCVQRSGLWLKTYNVLLIIIFTINISILVEVGTLASPKAGLNPEKALNAVAANVFATVLIRQEMVINLLHDICTNMPPQAPFVLRKHLANVHHFGGVHSGCAISALAWYIAYMVLDMQGVAKDRLWKRSLQIVDITTCCIVFGLLLLSVITALPLVRSTHHNVFERTHRFAGWCTMLALWIHTIISSLISVQRTRVLRRPSLYFLLFTSILLIQPWLRIRKIPVRATKLSHRELELVFDYDDMPATSTMRFSMSPIIEWHAFATIPGTPNQDGRRKEASIIIADAGDWTRDVIANPPTHIWMRNPPTRNFLRGVRMFNRVLLIATGAGISPVLSLLGTMPTASYPLLPTTSASASHSAISAHEPVRPLRSKVTKILWCANNAYAEHWEFAVQEIQRVDPHANIVDSRTARPDLVEEVGQMVEQWNMEAVFVVSKKEITDRIVHAVRLGPLGKTVAAYGASFDS